MKAPGAVRRAWLHGAAAAMARVAAAVLTLAVVVPAQAFDLQGHRGTRGLEPENTLAAFRRALEIGVDTLEMDAAITSDGVVVISHDPELPPAITRDAQGRWLRARGPLIRSISFAELQTYDVGRIDPASDYARQFPEQTPRDGERRPSLRQVFDLVRSLHADHVRFDIETKVFPDRPEATLAPEPFARALLDVIRAAGMTDRVMIQSFDWRTLKVVHALEPRMETVCLTARTRGFDNLEGSAWTDGLPLSAVSSVPHLVKRAGCTTWAPYHGNLTREALGTAHELGLKAIPWTVNDPADIDRLIGWGIDGIISDYPNRVRDVMARRSMSLPPRVPGAARP